MGEMKITDRLRLWQGRLKRSEGCYRDRLSRMDSREALCRGDRELSPLAEGGREQEGKSRQTPRVRGIVAEDIESQISTDMQERTVPIQGGSFSHVEWDNSRRSPGSGGGAGRCDGDVPYDDAWCVKGR